MFQRFEIHAHSDYSNIRLLDSINTVETLIKTADKCGLNGICLTDHETVAGTIEFFKSWKKLTTPNTEGKTKINPDFKIGCGNEIYLIDTRDKAFINRFYHFILLAKNDLGHQAIRELSSIAWYNSFTHKGMERVPTLKTELETIVKKYPNTLMASSACLGSEMGFYVSKLYESRNSPNAGDLYTLTQSACLEFINWCKSLFNDDFYLEIAPSSTPIQIYYNKFIMELSKITNTKVVIGTDAHYATKKDAPIHEAYLNAKEGDREVRSFYSSAYIMSNEEVWDYLKEYVEHTDFEQICNNSIEIMNKIEGYHFEHKSIIPTEEVPQYTKDPYNKKFEQYPSIQKYLESENEQDRAWINTCLTAAEEKNRLDEKNLARIDKEADIQWYISEKLGEPISAYHNTMRHYINLFWECGSIVGPGRGSACGWLTNMLLGITQIDPLRWGLNEWRYLNKERVELGDIDIDLAPSKRKAIFKEIRAKKGELNLLQVAAFGTEGTRSAILTACRGYRSEEFPNGIDVDTAQYLSSMIPQERGFLWDIEDVINGNEEKDRKPNKTFIAEVEQYPGLLGIIIGIAGLVNKRTQHASGVILYNDDPYKTNAIMRSPNGDLITQYSLHDAEFVGDVKFDFLVTEISDKIIHCLNLLQQDGIIEKDLSLRELYNKYLHPETINLKDNRMWDALAEGNILDVFQFNSEVGLQAAKAIKPTNPFEMTAANALMRLMAERGHERPLDKYTRFKNDIRQWYIEMREAYGLNESQIEILKPYYEQDYGVPPYQESVMLILMDKGISNFTLGEANSARKIIAKKQMKDIPKLKEKFFNQCEDKVLAKYVWDSAILPQLGYSFSINHSLPYSFVGIQTLLLATSFPVLYWNCACLIVNSGGIDELEDEEYDEDEEEEETEEEEKKKKVKAADYGRIAIALGQMQSSNVAVTPPDINQSSYTFSPDTKNNTIRYGLRGINKIGNDLVNTILAFRPYISIEDFLNKVKVNKPQMINLIKAGAFDSFGKDRVNIMRTYINLISDTKQRLNLQNMQMLISFNLIPSDKYEFDLQVYHFNKYLKKHKTGDCYGLDDIAQRFFDNHFSLDDLYYQTEGEYRSKISQKTWDKIYTKQMDGIRDYIKDNQAELLEKVNTQLTKDVWKKYCSGTLSKWEMDSVSFYSHEHELAELRERAYCISNFFKMPEDPEIEKVINMNGRDVPLFKLSRIAGTVLDKDKNKSTVTLLTKYGVVPVKIYRAQFVKYDKQISERQEDGHKKVIEKSWFTRGNKLIFTGIRRGDTFVPKVYKKSEFREPILLITSIEEGGYVLTTNQRANTEDDSSDM